VITATRTPTGSQLGVLIIMFSPLAQEGFKPGPGDGLTSEGSTKR
jgi:hypothetical protein